MAETKKRVQVRCPLSDQSGQERRQVRQEDGGSTVSKGDLAQAIDEEERQRAP